MHKGFLAAALLPLVSGTAAFAAGHYGNGVEGIKAASPPPPGDYYIMYNQIYNSDALRDHDGHSAGRFSVTALANAHRYVHVTNQRVLGADFFWDFVIPLVYSDIDIPDAGVRETHTGLADIYLEPVGLAWHETTYDLAFAAGVFLPTGKSDDIGDPGKGFYTFMLTGGGTWYFDREKAWSLSVLGRYEWHTEQRDLDYTPGDDFHFEWGLGRQSGNWEAGITGYVQWQVDDDDIDRDSHISANTRDHVAAAGPEINRFFPEAGVKLTLRTQWEFDASDTTKGNVTTFNFTQIF